MLSYGPGRGSFLPPQFRNEQVGFGRYVARPPGLPGNKYQSVKLGLGHPEVLFFQMLNKNNSTQEIIINLFVRPGWGKHCFPLHSAFHPADYQASESWG